jgi:hypothetical protein
MVTCGSLKIPATVGYGNRRVSGVISARFKARLGRKGRKVLLDLLVRKVLLGLLVRPGRRVFKVRSARRVLKDRQVVPARPVPPVKQALRVRKDQKVIRDLSDHRERKV